MRLTSMVWLLLITTGCEETKSYPESSSIEVDESEDAGQLEDTGEAPDEGIPPASCVIDSEVCASYSADWSADEAAEHCAEFGGSSGECAQGAVGICSMDSGLIYHIYELPEWEAEGYCDWLSGDWTTGDRQSS